LTQSHKAKLDAHRSSRSQSHDPVDGHDVVPFADEREALDQIRTDIGIEALITSAELNYMSGAELCSETRLIATSRRPI
jgi:PleD family two-component response regulator